MLGHMMFGNYVMVRKSTLMLAALAAMGSVGYHFYKYHRSEIKRGAEEFADDVGDVAKKGTRKAKEVADEAKK